MTQVKEWIVEANRNLLSPTVLAFCMMNNHHWQKFEPEVWNMVAGEWARKDSPNRQMLLRTFLDQDTADNLFHQGQALEEAAAKYPPEIRRFMLDYGRLDIQVMTYILFTSIQALKRRLDAGRDIAADVENTIIYIRRKWQVEFLIWFMQNALALKFPMDMQKDGPAKEAIDYLSRYVTI